MIVYDGVSWTIHGIDRVCKLTYILNIVKNFGMFMRSIEVFKNCVLLMSNLIIILVEFRVNLFILCEFLCDLTILKFLEDG